MSQMTNYMENALADFARGEALTLPFGWHLALASAASDASITEITGIALARQIVPRTLTDWSGTQGVGSVLASTGASHVTSNNAIVDFGTSTGSATASHIVLYDATSGGNAWAYFELVTPLVIGNGDPVTFAAGSVAFTLGLAGGMSKYLANKMIDKVFRGQTYTWPATQYLAAYTTSPTNADTGTEFAGGSYARVSIASSLAAWSSTVSAGSVGLSTAGSGGRISNNAPATYPAPTTAHGDMTHEGLRDAATAGNLMFWGALASPKTIAAGGSPPSHSAGSIGITFA
ncbi:MAG: hypothetical protein ABI024_03965 [Vicinamibacterales bacterium]